MKAILHCDKKWGIGKNNSLMFSIPADMKFFRQKTTGNVVVMGQNTLYSFPDAKPLKNRVNIVLSFDLEREDVINVHSIDELLEETKKYQDKEVYIIGGASVYRQMLPYCDEVLVTKVDAEGDADAFFPNLDEDDSFECVYTSEPVVTNGYTVRFTTYRRR